jgi:putative spermidine/putrescine transport system ATP-binding protein
MAGTTLVLEGLAKSYGGAPPVVSALSLAVEPGEMVGLLGPSGCGKTTTLRMIGGLIEATAGRVLVDGRDVTGLPPHRRDMGIVFQNYALFPHMTVAQNVAFGLDMRGVKRRDSAGRVEAALDLVQLGTLAARRPRELSGGQQQRVALARALVIEPSILLLDEPLSNLDAKLREEMRGEIGDIQKRLGITTVFVTHDQAEALALCDRIAVMHQGRIAQLGPPADIYERPASEFVADFVGRSNRFEGRAAADGSIALGGLAVRAAAPVPAGAVTVMIRPHRIALGAAPMGPDWNRAAGRVTRVTYVGDMLACDVAAGGVSFLVEQPTLPGVMAPREGEECALAWRLGDTLVFPRAAA